MSAHKARKTNKITFCDDEYAESEFARLRLAWQKIVIPASSIDREASKFNRARLSKELDNAHVDTLVRCLESGRPMKRIVVVKNPNGKYSVISGHHRDISFTIYGADDYEVYEIIIEDDDDADKVFTVLAVSLNAEAVWRASNEELFAQAVNLVARGMSVKDAAEATQVSASALQHRIRNRRVIMLLQIAGRRVKEDTSTKLSPLATLVLDTVITAAAKLALDANFTKDQIESLTRDLKKRKSSEASQLAYIEKFRLELRAKEVTGAELGERISEANPPKPNKTRTSFFRCLMDFEKLTAGVITLKTLGIMESEMADTRSRCNAISKAFRTLSKS